MNEQQFETKIEKDGTRIKKAVTTFVGDGVSQIKDKYGQFSGTIKESANEAVTTMKKNIENGIKQYNSKAVQVADSVPGDINKKISKYPWVVISLGLVFGLLLGFLLKPSRQSM